ncbi:MAG TPA: hypothetical protein DEB31_03350 [Clostridiales bacterium]|nr:hypothetical protein [Clostridiales bacterium]
MELKSILQLLKAAEESGFDTIEIAEKEFSMKLSRAKEPVAAVVAQAAPEQAEAAPTPEAENTSGKAPGSHDIVSPLVGIFHELSGGKKVEIGSKLKKGEPVCAIEAMKLMNEIDMPEDGEIVWVAAEEGATVEYGQILFSYVK